MNTFTNIGAENVSARGQTPEPPYCWQSKDARRKIRDFLDGDTSKQQIALAVYDAMTEIASNNSSSVFKVSQSSIAGFAGGYNVRSVQRVLPKLREIGVIHYPEQQGNETLTYTICSIATDSRTSKTDGRASTTGTQNASQSHVRRTNRNNSQNKHTEPPLEAVIVSDDGFEEFWNNYPKKINKDEAKTAWIESNTRPPLDQMMKALSSYRSTECSRIEERFIPAASKWIQEERWVSYLPKPSATKVVRAYSVEEQEAAFEWLRQEYPDAVNNGGYSSWRNHRIEEWIPHIRKRWIEENNVVAV